MLTVTNLRSNMSNQAERRERMSSTETGPQTTQSTSMPQNRTGQGVTGNNNTKLKLTCRYFLSGTCRFGDNCRYSHSPAANEQSPGSSSRTGTNIHAPEFVPKAYQNPVVQVPVEVKKGAKRKSAKKGDFPLDSEPNANLKIIDDDEELESEEEEEDDNINVITSYAEICKQNLNLGEEGENFSEDFVGLCPYLMKSEEGVCVYGETCPYEHGDLCDLCGLFCLHPSDEEERKRHQKECLEQHEKDMELSFAIAQSKDKSCGICFEIVIEKQGNDKRFGILQNCNHVFCLECIRKWRMNKEKQFNSQIARSCPECRITSDFICPSAYWVGNEKEAKEKLINDYKNALSDKHCKYFKNGDGKCPFGNKCFYKHVDKHNRKVDVGDPKKIKRYNANGEAVLLRSVRDLLLYDMFRNFDSDFVLTSDSDDDDDDYNFDDDDIDWAYLLNL